MQYAVRNAQTGHGIVAAGICGLAVAGPLGDVWQLDGMKAAVRHDIAVGSFIALIVGFLYGLVWESKGVYLQAVVGVFQRHGDGGGFAISRIGAVILHRGGVVNAQLEGLLWWHSSKAHVGDRAAGLAVIGLGGQGHISDAQLGGKNCKESLGYAGVLACAGDNDFGIITCIDIIRVTQCVVRVGIQRI